MFKEPAMSNADREFEIRCPWLGIGVLAFFSVGSCFAGISVALELDPEFRVSSVAARIGLFCVAEAEAVLFGYPAICWAIQRVRRRQRLAFTDTTIIITDGPHFWSNNPKSAPYADLKRVRYTTIGDIRTIKIAFASGSFSINPHLLPRKTDFDELLSELTRRLKPLGMEVETREYLCRGPQFSLRFMLVATAVVAAGFGLWRWVDPEFHLTTFVFLAIAGLVMVIGSFISIFGNWSARIFALGFGLGMMLELQLVLHDLGGGIPMGPYSSTMVCHQMLTSPGDPPMKLGDLIWDESFRWLFLGGTMISGIVGGTALLLAWLAVKRVIRRRRARGTAVSS